MVSLFISRLYYRHDLLPAIDNYLPHFVGLPLGNIVLLRGLKFSHGFFEYLWSI